MAFIFQLKNYPIRTIKSILLGFAFIGVGLFVAVMGPALLDLQMLAGVELEKIAGLLPSRSFGYAVGSVVAGVLGDKGMDHQLLIMVAVFFAAITSLGFPLFPNIIAMYILASLGGIANGFIDTIGNVWIKLVWIIHLWGKENPPFMQIMHFFFGIGAFAAPFLVEPFLTISPNENSIDEYLSVNPEIKGDYSRIKWPFIVAAAFNFLVLIGFAVVYYIYPDNPIHPSSKKDNNELESDNKKDKLYLKKPIDGLIKIFVICLSTLAMHAYVGIEISFGSLLTTFAVKSNLHMSKPEGSFLTSTYWGMYTFLRIFSLIAIIYISPGLLLLIDFAIIMISNVILVPYANNYRWALWTGSALMGIGCSNVFGTVFAFLGQLTPISGRVTSGFMIAACAGEFIIPLLVGAYIKTLPVIFLWVVCFYSSISFICVLILLFTHYKLLKKQKNNRFRQIELSNPGFDSKPENEDTIY